MMDERVTAAPRRFLQLMGGSLLVVALAGCAAMEGINVGANVPLGGIVNVGVNKTIGEQPAPAPSKKDEGDDAEATGEQPAEQLE